MIKKTSFFAASAVLSALLLTSCTGAPDEEIIIALNELAPKATELYGVIYGDTLPHGEADESGMCAVSKDAKYNSEAELTAAMLEVFTEDYTAILRNTAFIGVSADEGDINPKFFEQNGVFYVCPSATQDFNVPTDIDLTGANVVKKNKYMAIVNIPLGDGVEDDIEVTLRLTEEGWLIDSPLF